MPKTPSNKLFNLVKSLSGSEKRYFNIYANNKWGDRQNKYLKLFTAIDQQKEFDEEALKREIYKDEKFESRKYSELKRTKQNRRRGATMPGAVAKFIHLQKHLLPVYDQH